MTSMKIRNLKTVQGVKSRSKKSIWETIFRQKWLFMMLIPGMTLLIIFKYIPMYVIIIAFKDFNIVKGIWQSPWVGLDNLK